MNTRHSLAVILPVSAPLPPSLPAAVDATITVCYYFIELYTITF